MIISDLNHLEVVSEASSVVGGKLDVDLDIKKNLKIDVKKGNVTVINKFAAAAAVTLDGKAIAKAEVK